MNAIRIVAKEFLHNLRDWRPNALMILMPIVLMAVLGAALSGVFSHSFSLDARVLYTVKEEGTLSNAFMTFTPSVAPMGVSFTPAKSEEQGREAVKNVTYACYITISNTGILLSKNSRFGFEADFVQSLLQAFLQRYNAIAAIAAEKPAAAMRILSAQTAQEPWVRSSTVEARKSPGAMDYYAVTMLTLTIMYAALFGMSGIKRELRLKTAERMLSAPVRKWEILSGKVVGGIFVTLVQVILVILFSRYVIGAYWGHDIFTVVLVLLSESAMAVGMGAGVAYLIKNEGAANGILNTFFPVMVLFAGGYAPMDGLGPVFDRIASLDPLKWVNRSILDVIYYGDYSKVAPAVLSCLGVAAVFITVAAAFSGKESVSS